MAKASRQMDLNTVGAVAKAFDVLGKSLVLAGDVDRKLIEIVIPSLAGTQEPTGCQADTSMAAQDHGWRRVSQRRIWLHVPDLGCGWGRGRLR